MKKEIFSCVAKVILMVFLSSGCVFAAEGENTGFYVGVSGGYVMPQTLTASGVDFKLKNGYLAGVKAGWITPFTKKIMAMELEYNYIFGTDFDSWNLGGSSGIADGTIKFHALLFNLKARYPEGRFHPYAGFGLGEAYLQREDIMATVNGTRVVAATALTDNGFCYQLLAGLDIDITPNISVGIGYKYFVPASDYKASIVTLGLAYTF